MQNHNDHMAGYVRYFTDIPAVNGYPSDVIFPRDDLMTAIRHGGFNTVLDGNNGEVTRCGIKKLYMTAAFTSAHYTGEYEPEIAAKALEPYKKGTIGLVGTSTMSFAFGDYLRRHFTNAKFVEASDLVDQIKVVKSEEEQERCIATAHMQDEAPKFAFSKIQPGMTDSQVAANAQHYVHSKGGEMGLYNCASTPPGVPARGGGWHFGQRKVGKGDMLYLLVETNGPGRSDSHLPGGDHRDSGLKIGTTTLASQQRPLGPP